MIQSSPQVRFPQGNSSKADWHVAELGELTTLMQSGLSRLLSDEDIGIPVIRSNNIQNGRLDLSDIRYWYLDDPQGANTSLYILEKGDLLVNFINSIAQIGKVAMVSNELARPMIFTTNIMRLRFTKEVDSRYVYYFFNSPQYDKYIYSITKPAVNQASFTKKDFVRFHVPLPSLAEQLKIADFLGAVDAKLDALRRKRALLAKYKRGVMQKLFTQEVRFVGDGGRPFADWSSKSLSDLGTFVSDGIHSTPVYDENGSYYFINGNNLVNGKIVVSETTKRVNESEYQKHRKDLNHNTILMSINGTIGNLAFYNSEKVILGKSACYINLDVPQTDKLFVYYLLQTHSVRRKFHAALTGTTIKNLSLAAVKNTKFEFPTIQEQKKIADFLTAIDNKITAVDQQIAQIETFKKGLLQQMFV